VGGKGLAAARLAELMDCGELHGRIIRDVAELDAVLDTIIASYFAPPSRARPLKDLVLIKLSTYTKVGVVEHLPYRRRPRSLRHIQSLKDIVQARNFLAHTHRLPAGDLPPRVEPWLYLLADYPTAYQAHLQSIRRMLRYLLAIRDIAGPRVRADSAGASR
jgi:hypothetical protein